MSSWATLSFVEVLEDLSSRFIVNLPSEELQRIERICFQVEQAHWFYEDFLRPLNPSLPSLNLRKFSIYILQTASLSVPLIRQYVSSGPDSNGTVVQLEDLGGMTYGLEAAFDEFLKYKTRVPVCGAVLLCDDWKSCLLVKGWKSSASWGFPKGKINQNEDPRDCAVRETFEETGFDCSHLLKPGSGDWMELNVREQKMRLYIVPGVLKDTVFETQTRKEISKISWFKLADLPTWKQSKAAGGGGLSSANAGSKFYLVTPFIGKLKQWINDNKKKRPGPDASVDAIPSEPAAMRQAHAAGHDIPTEPAAMRKTSRAAATQAAASSLLFADSASSWPLGGASTSKAAATATEPNAAAPASAAPSTDSDSAALLAMLQGSLNLQQGAGESSTAAAAAPPPPPPPALPTSPSPLPAPRPQKSTTQTLKLLEMLSPGTPQKGSKEMPAEGHGGPVAAAAAGPTTDLSAAEEERKRKRALLLQQLMGGSAGSQAAPHPQTDQQAAAATLLSLVNGGPAAAAPSSSQESALLALLSPQANRPMPGPSAAAQEPLSMPGGGFGPSSQQQQQQQPNGYHAYAQQGGAGSADDAGRNSLLAMLNAGPMRSEAASQQPLQMHSQLPPSTAMSSFSPQQSHLPQGWVLPPPQHMPSPQTGFAAAISSAPPPPWGPQHHPQHPARMLGAGAGGGGPDGSPVMMHAFASPRPPPPPHHHHQHHPHHGQGGPPPFSQAGGGPASLLAQLQPRPPAPHHSPAAHHSTAPPPLPPVGQRPQYQYHRPDHQQQPFSAAPGPPQVHAGFPPHMSPHRHDMQPLPAMQQQQQPLSPPTSMPMPGPPQGNAQPQSLLALLNGR